MNPKTTKRRATGIVYPCPDKVESQMNRAYYAYILKGERNPRLLKYDPMTWFAASLEAEAAFFRLMPYNPLDFKSKVPSYELVLESLRTSGEYKTVIDGVKMAVWIESD